MVSGAIDVLGIGHGTEDHVFVVERMPTVGAKVRAREYFVQAGGQVPTALVALQRWGLRTAFASPVGDDEGGARQIASLRGEGVAVGGCRTCPGARSQLSFITVDAASGERTIEWYRDSALRLRPNDDDRALAASARALLLDGEDVDAAVELATIARDRGATVVLDADEARPELTALLSMTDVAIVPVGFLRGLSGIADPSEALKDLGARGPRVAVVTLGERGALAWTDGEVVHQPAFSCEAVDSTSAGDVFHAGFVYSLLRGESVAAALRFAAAASSICVERLGGRSSIPALAEVHERLDS